MGTRWPRAVSVLLVGAGTMGRVHGEAWAQMQQRALGIRVVGVVDPDANGARLAADLNVPHWVAWEDAPLSEVDLVDVASPTPTHAGYVEAAAASGKAILCEKPLALTVEEAEAIASAVHRGGVRLAVGHVVRYFPAYRRAHDLVVAGDLGAVAVAHLYRGGAFPRGHRDWYQDRRQSGGPLLDLSLHDFDFLLWTFGAPASVFAQEVDVTEPTPLAHATATLRFPHGLLAQVVGSWAGTRFGTRLELAGSEGLLAHDSLRDETLRLTRRQGVDRPADVAVPGADPADNPWERQLTDVVDRLVHDRPFEVGLPEALAAIRLASEARQSVLSGGVVTCGGPQ